MSAWICTPCGNHYPASESPPGFLDEDAVRRVAEAGGLRAVTASQFLRGEVAVD